MVRPPLFFGHLFFVACGVLSVGCSHLQWSPHGPGAPGLANSDASPPFPSLTEPAPFSATEQEKISSMQRWVESVAHTHQLDPDLINGVIWVESRFDPRARSSAGARGLMQLMPATAHAMAEQMGRARPRLYDPQFNVEAGSRYLLRLLDRFDGDETLALAAYHAGAGNVNRWMREDGTLPARSLEYVELVQHARARFVAMRHSSPSSVDQRMLATAPSTSPPQPQPPVPATASAPPAPEPTNPLAPAPDVYRPVPPPEPPLKDTPYPPLTPRPPHHAEPVVVSPAKTPPDRISRLPSVLD